MLSSSRPDPTPLRARLAARDAELARLSAQVAALRAALRDAPKPPERREAVADSARERQATSPRSGGRPPAGRRLLPYAAIAAVALALELAGRRGAPAPAPDSFAFARPAAVAPAGVVAAPGAPLSVAEDDRSGEALHLAQEWTPPGDTLTLLERFGDDLPGAPSAWSVERTGESAYRVSVRRGAAEPWEFDADLDARTVAPAPGTADRLAPAYANLRDALRE